MSLVDKIKTYVLFAGYPKSEAIIYIGTYVAETFDYAVLKGMEYYMKSGNDGSVWTYSLAGQHKYKGLRVFHLGNDGKRYYE